MKQQHDEQQATTQDRDETRSRDVRGVSAGSVGDSPLAFFCNGPRWEPAKIKESWFRLTFDVVEGEK